MTPGVDRFDSFRLESDHEPPLNHPLSAASRVMAELLPRPEDRWMCFRLASWKQLDDVTLIDGAPGIDVDFDRKTHVGCQQRSRRGSPALSMIDVEGLLTEVF